MIISGKPLQGGEQRERVKVFLLRALANDPNALAHWPDFYTYIFIDGAPYRVVNGQWQIGSSAVYLPQAGNYGVTKEVQIAVLAAIAEFWALGQDEEVKEALVNALVKVAADLWITIQRVTSPATTEDGNPVKKIALKGGEMAGLIGDVWRKPNGEAVPMDDGWVQFALEV